MAKFHIFRSFIFPPTPVFPTIFPPERENKSQTGRKKHAHFFFFAAWRKKNRMHVRHFFRQFSSFGPISWPIAGKLVFSLRCNKQYVRLGQCCWFFSLFFWHSESGFALPSCQKNRENKTANIALGAQLLFFISSDRFFTLITWFWITFCNQGSITCRKTFLQTPMFKSFLVCNRVH